MIEGADKYTSLFDLWVLSHRVRSIIDDRLTDSGLSADDFAMYSLCAGQGPSTPKQLAQWVGVRPSTLSAYISRIGKYRPKSISSACFFGTSGSRKS